MSDQLIVERLQDLRICDIGLRRVAANRIKALNNENDILLGEVEYLEMMRDDLQKAFTRAADTRDRLRALLAEAASDLTAYVDAEYPPDTCDQYPDIARRHYRDMELVRRIKAELKGESHD